MTEPDSTALDTTIFMPPGDLGAAFVKMFLTFIALVILLLVSYWFLRCLVQNRLQKGVEIRRSKCLKKG